MEGSSDKDYISVKGRFEKIKNDPDLFIILLLQKDPIVKCFYKRPHKKKSNVEDTDLKSRLLRMKENPEVRLNRELWCSLKRGLLHFYKDKNYHSLLNSDVDKRTALKGEGSFFLWLLNAVGLSPHHTRQMLRYYLKSLQLLGKSICEWTVDDVFLLMILRLNKGQGGAREIFELSRLYWLYTSDQTKLDNFITRILYLTEILK